VFAVQGEARRAVHLRLTSDSRPNSGQVAKPSIARTTLVPKLNRLNLGVEAWVVLFESGQAGTPNRDTYSRTLLGYAKTEEGWGFAVKDKRIERGFFENDPTCRYENEYDEGSANKTRVSRNVLAKKSLDFSRTKRCWTSLDKLELSSNR